MDPVTTLLWPLALGFATFQVVHACVSCQREVAACLIGGAGGALLWWARFLYGVAPEALAWFPLTLVALVLMLLPVAARYGFGTNPFD